MEESILNYANSNNVALYIALLAGTFIIFLVFLSGRLWKNRTCEEGEETSSHTLIGSEENAQDKRGNRSKSKKKPAPDRRRDLKSVFSHAWLLTSLKGHSGNVLDMDFSSNGKYLASCADESPKPKQCGGLIVLENSDEDSSSSQGSKSQGLTRRQRRNASKRKQDGNGYLNFYQKLGLDDKQIYSLLKSYIINKDELMNYGFPVECSTKPGLVLIQETNGFNNNGLTVLESGIVLQKCYRCHSAYFTEENGRHISREPCWYHWGKLKKVNSADSTRIYSCCNSVKDSRGCTQGACHVCLGPTSGIFEDFVRTAPNKFNHNGENFGIFAMDCEMCFTTKGLELVKVTLLKPNGSIAYDSLVKPSNPVVDCNTRFSGITAKKLAKATKTLQDVQRDLLKLINSDTILIGHSLDNDLRALHILHSTIVDTSVVFPHFFGMPYRRSLKSLMISCLKKHIQTDIHNSVEDAQSCLELMLWRLKKDLLRRKNC